ncbi:MAG: hypothetical protein AABY22_24800, partial [Nanoarchaeota archaeon]
MKTIKTAKEIMQQYYDKDNMLQSIEKCIEKYHDQFSSQKEETSKVEPDGYIWNGEFFDKNDNQTNGNVSVNNTPIKYRPDARPIYFYPVKGTEVKDGFEEITATEFLNRINSIPNYTASNMRINLKDAHITIGKMSISTSVKEEAKSFVSEEEIKILFMNYMHKENQYFNQEIVNIINPDAMAERYDFKYQAFKAGYSLSPSTQDEGET